MDPLQPGDPISVGSYRLLGRLGAGGMGQVFLGISPGGRKVAVKVIHPFHLRAPHFRERFAREIEAAQRVGGFHTAPVVDADPRASPPWMVTAFIAGQSLQDAVDQDGPLSPGEVRALGAGLAEGLAAIHARGLVHRDLKPGNVILAPDGPRIIDFGIARVIDETTGITTAGAVIGTFAYMSPEHLGGEAAGPASDVFSLGSVLAFAATGRPPFTGDTAATVMFRLVSAPPDLAGLADHELTGLVSSCLAKTPEARPTVSSLLAALSGPGPAALRAGAPGMAAPYAPGIAVPRAPANGAPATQAPALPGTGPAPGNGPASRAPTVPPGPAEAVPGGAVPGGAGHIQPSRGRPRRWPAALIATVALAVALAVALPLLFASGSPPAAGSGRPGSATSSGTTTRPGRASSTPAASKPSQSPDSTASRTSPAAEPSTSRPARSTSPQEVAIPDPIGESTEQAIRALQAAGFVVKVSKFGTFDKVFDYSPVGSAPRGSTITLDTGF
jgi:predicted Ser/Thr protein kinase